MVGPIGDVNISTLGLRKTNSLLQNTIAKISSGSKIPFAANDPTGLSVSEKFRGQIRGFTKASSNIQDGISLLNTAEGGLASTSENLLRLRELTIQAGNGALAQEDIQAIEQEARAILDEIDGVSNRTEFNTRGLLNGSTSGTVSSAQGDVNPYITGSLAQSGSFSGSIQGSFDDQGNKTIEMTLSGNGVNNTVTLDKNFRANNILAGLDVSLDEVTSAEVSGRQIATEDVISTSSTTQITLTDNAGDTTTVSFSQGNNSLGDMVEQLNSSFQANNVDVSASLDDGNLVLMANNSGESFTISDTSLELTQSLGITDGTVNSVDGETAELEGQTEQNRVSRGVEFQSQISFEVSSSSGSSTRVNLGGANQILTEFEIEREINQQLAAGAQNIRANFADGELTFSSADIGNRSEISITDISAGPDNLSRTLGVDDQTSRGSGSSNFTINVSPGTLTFQTGTNQGQANDFAFGNFSSDALNLSDLNFSDSESRDDFLSRLDSAIDRTSSARASIGAQSNRFQSQFNSVQNSILDQSATESLIRDVDLAKQAIEMNKNQSLLNSAIFAQTQMLDLNRNFLGSLIE